MFESETDTEVVAHLIDQNLESGLAPLDALKAALDRLRGRLRHRADDRGRGRADPGRPARTGAGGRLRRGRDVPRLRRAGGRPVHQPHRHLEDGDYVAIDHKGARIFDAAGRAGRAADPHRAHRPGAGRKGQLPPLHGKGDPRPARRLPAHALDLCRCGDRQGGGARPRLQQIRAAADRRLRHRLLRRHDRALPVRAAGAACRPTSRSPRSSATASRRWRPARWRWRSPSRARRPTPWPRCAGASTRNIATAALVNAHESTMAREADVLPAHQRRARDRRRLDQGLHLAAGGADRAGRGRRPPARADRRCGGGQARGAAARDPAADRRVAAGRGAGARHRPGNRQGPRRALPRPRRDVPAGAGGGAEAEGNQLHPRRGLRRRRAEARARSPWSTKPRRSSSSRRRTTCSRRPCPT